MTSTALIEGYQVFDPATGEHACERASFEILTLPLAVADLQATRREGDHQYLLVAILPNDIEAPEYVQ